MTILVGSGNEQLAKERLAQLVKALRGNATQREFAKLLGTSYTAVQDWEKQVRLPNEENLRRIAQLQGWTLEALLLYLFRLDRQPEITTTDLLESLITQIQTLSLPQMQQLSRYLNTQLSRIQDSEEKGVICALSDQQKHNLHLLLRASLKHQSPTAVMAASGIDPALFTDVFLRNETSRTVSYEDLEKLSGLCCRVISWRVAQLPEVDCDQTYLGETTLLFKTLAEGNKVMVDSP